MKVEIVWTDPGNDGSGPKSYWLEVIKVTKTMILLRNGVHIERWRRKDGTQIGEDEHIGWEINPAALASLNEAN
jgi:hypothetical protein